MIAKKNSGHDLERKRNVFFQVGLLTAASFTLAAFTYTSKLPGASNERLISMEDQSIILDIEPQEKQRIENQPEIQPRIQNPDPNPSDPNLPGNPNLQNVSASNNQNGPIVPFIGPPTGGVKRTVIVVDEGDIVEFPPIAAEYRGGVPAMKKRVNDNIHYPEIDRELNVQGTVYLSFVIERDGTVSNVKIERGVSETIDREAIRVVKMLNQWIPAQNAFGKVRTIAHLPIVFHLEK